MLADSLSLFWLTLCHHVAFATCQFVKDNDNFCRFLVKGSVLGKSKQSDFQHYTPLMRSDSSFELWFIVLLCCLHDMDCDLLTRYNNLFASECNDNSILYTSALDATCRKLRAAGHFSKN